MRFIAMMAVLVTLPEYAFAEVTGRIEHTSFKGEGPLQLGDLITFSGGTPERLQQLDNYPIQWPKQQKWLSASNLKEIAHKVDTYLPQDWAIEGYRQVFVQKCWQLSKSALQSKVQQYLYNHVNAEKVRFKSVHFNGDQEDLCVLQQPDNFEVAVQNLAVIFKRQRVNLLVDGQVILSPIMDLSIEQKKPVLKALIRKGTQIAPSQLSWKWFPVTRVYSDDIDVTYSNVIATQNIKRGARVTMANTKTQPDVSHGEWVVFSMTSGAISIKGKARALSDGVIGESVQVVLEGQGQSISAKVVNKGAVVVSN
ncbi:flagellar basal body P-ring formation chaperone FlgA [Pseudoalteromonas sp.]|uniref:flagellar basal body P-ring formation chaperone FlgA n=1 Tax=Pseudoalteromonas sp. TaxID=53249 RepID=UPI00235545EA|nr:flagellar basal body P-ring formation chaperone FlgA [Pseudoalteromonas sp.]